MPVRDQEELIVGRDAELACLVDVLDPASADRVVTLLGDMGTGKSALLDQVARLAAADGVRVLRAEGTESESSLAFSGPHQLLRLCRPRRTDFPGSSARRYVPPSARMRQDRDLIPR